MSKFTPREGQNYLTINGARAFVTYVDEKETYPIVGKLIFTETAWVRLQWNKEGEVDPKLGCPDFSLEAPI